MPTGLFSAIYSGTVRHRRFSPKHHEFTYNVFMMYLDTSELQSIFSLSPFWSNKHWAPALFKRTDFHIDSNNKNAATLPTVDESVRNSIEYATGTRPTGAIRMLVNLRYWGINMNPISTYYCFDEHNNLETILAEVHNTPWNERHSYILPNINKSKKQKYHFDKAFHVSPFNPINMEYRWNSTAPDDNLLIHLENWQNSHKVMDATMTLHRTEISPASLNKILIQFPFMTVKVITAIYWQALLLWLKGVPTTKHQTISAPAATEDRNHEIN